MLCYASVARASTILTAVAQTGFTSGVLADDGVRFENAAKFWVRSTTELVVRYQQNPLRAARALAYVTAAIHDAGRGAAESSAVAAVPTQHLVGGMMLGYLYPQEGPTKQRAIGWYLAHKNLDRESPPVSVVATAQNTAEAVFQAARARAVTDRASRVWNIRDRPDPRPGIWVAAPPLNMYSPAEPLAGQWATWVIGAPAQSELPVPVPYGTPEYLAEVEEVLRIARGLSNEQKAIADRWHLDKGSVTPPGVWNIEALSMLERERTGAERSALVLSALNVAMADALVAAWHVKFKYWTARPVTAIREKLDPAFLPYLITPPFPSFVSGHAAASGAAAEVLGFFFPGEAGRLAALANEAAESRLLGGIHFRSDNESGLALGRWVGRLVCTRVAAEGADLRWLAVVPDRP